MERAAGARSRAWQQSGIRPEFAQPPAFSTPPQHERGTHEREICISVREEGRKLDGERGREISGVDKKKKKKRVCKEKLSEERCICKGTCRDIFTVEVVFIPMQHSVNLIVNSRAILDHVCLTVYVLKKMFRNTHNRAFSVLERCLTKEAVVTKGCRPQLLFPPS